MQLRSAFIGQRSRKNISHTHTHTLRTEVKGSRPECLFQLPPHITSVCCHVNTKLHMNCDASRFSLPPGETQGRLDFCSTSHITVHNTSIFNVPRLLFVQHSDTAESNHAATLYNLTQKTILFGGLGHHKLLVLIIG